MKKKVVYSTDFNLDYLFFLPITTLAWKSFTDFDPICFLIGSESEWKSKPITKYVLEKGKEVGADIHFIGKVEGTRESTVAQVSRLYSGCLDMPDSTYILTSDIDMLPLNKQWFNQGDPLLDFHLFFANANNHERYPICYLGGYLKAWREIMHIERNTSINNELNKELLLNLGKDADKRTAWDYDETLFVNKIKQWNGYNTKSHMINRQQTPKGPPLGRVDRYDWVFSKLEDYHVDAHMFRPAWLDEYWYKINIVLSNILNSDQLEFCNVYKNKFKELL